jgi:hypothetical protein
MLPFDARTVRRSALAGLVGAAVACGEKSSKPKEITADFGIYTIDFPRRDKDPRDGTLRLHLKVGFMSGKNVYVAEIDEGKFLSQASVAQKNQQLMIATVLVERNVEVPKDIWINTFDQSDLTKPHTFSYTWKEWKITEVKFDNDKKLASELPSPLP